MRQFKKMTRQESEQFFNSGEFIPTSIMAVPFTTPKYINCTNCRASLEVTVEHCDSCGQEQI